MRATKLSGPPNTTPESKFDWLTRAVRQLSDATQTSIIGSTTFANLPSVKTIGQMYYITDSTVNTWGTTIAGGGAFKVLGWWNGTHWTVFAI